MTREHIIEAYMINDKRVIAEMLYDTIAKYEEKLKPKSCEDCKYLTDDEYKENCFIVDACIKNDIKLPDSFCCNEFEPKDEE